MKTMMIMVTFMMIMVTFIMIMVTFMMVTMTITFSVCTQIIAGVNHRAQNALIIIIIIRIITRIIIIRIIIIMTMILMLTNKPPKLKKRIRQKSDACFGETTAHTGQQRTHPLWKSTLR